MATEPTTAATSLRVLYAGSAPGAGPSPDDVETRRERFTVVQHREFEDALDHVERGGVDCVVASHDSEGFDGLAFLEAVRRDRPELPVVLVTATDDGGVARRAVAADVDAFVPASDADALDAVATALSEAATASAENGRMPVSDLGPAAERRLKERVLDEAPIGITISDATRPDQPIVYANGSFEAITGYSPADVMGRIHRFLQGPETDREKVDALGAEIAAENETRFVLRNYRRDGTMFWNQVDITPIRDDGDVTHYVGFQMDVTERERAKRELEAERAALDQLLDRIEGLLNDVTESLVRASDRDEIERLVTERFGGGDEYATAWLGRYDAADRELSVTEWAGRNRVGEPPISLDGDQPAGRQRLAETVERSSVQAVADTAGLPAPEGVETCLLLPLTYRSVTYGVLAVFADTDRVTDRERVLLGALARSVGTSINDVLTKQSMATDSVRTVGVGLYDDTFLTDIAGELGCRFEHEILVESADDGEIRELVSTDQADGGAVVSAANAHSDVVAAEPLVTGADGCVVELRLDDWPLVDLLSEFGAQLGSLSADSRRIHVEFRAGTENGARRAVEALRETYDTVELVAYHEDEPRQTTHGFRESVREHLTERQLTALKKAYVGGFFEWPRAIEGQQLADSMDIVPSTFHQHLQAAERKVFATLFEE